MGLLARATELLEQEEAKAVAAATNAKTFKSYTKKQQKTKTNNNQKLNQQFHKLRKFVLAVTMSMTSQITTPVTFDANLFNFKYQEPLKIEMTMPTADQEKALNQHIENFAQGLQSKISRSEREVLARMLYGEAGRGADPFEVLHTVLNRAASPLFKGSLTDIVTQKNQYVGYNAKNPLTKDYLDMVDLVIDEWEANDCKKIDGCNHYYFVTGIPGVCNKFEVSPDQHGKWVPTASKKYATMQHYCDTATAQAKRFFAERNQQQASEHSL